MTKYCIQCNFTTENINTENIQYNYCPKCGLKLSYANKNDMKTIKKHKNNTEKTSTDKETKTIIQEEMKILKDKYEDEN